MPRSNTRADVAVIGATMDGFEIKTERDTLKRLPHQAEAYAQLFDRCHAVLAHRHVDRALEILPAWWGVTVIGTAGPPSLVQFRQATANDGVDPEALVRLLWRNEVYAVLCGLGTAPDPAARRAPMWRQLLGLVDLDGLKLVVRQALLGRDPAKARFPSQRFAVT